MNRRLSVLFLILSCFSFTSLSFSQNPWSLQKCINHAFEHNLQIKQSALGVDLADIGLLSATGAFTPSINASGSHGYNIGMTIDPFTNEFASDAIQSNSFGLSSGVTLYNGFRNHLNLKRAKIGLELAATNLERTQNDVSLVISSAYLNVLFQEEFVNIATLNLDATKRQVNRMTQLVDAGAVAAADLLDVQAQQASDYATLISSENARALAKLNLTQLLQLSFEEASTFEIVMPTGSDLESTALPASASKAINHALRTFPEIRAASLTLEDANINLDLAKTGYLPRLFASYNFGSGYSGNRIQGDVDPITTEYTIMTQEGVPLTAPIIDDSHVMYSTIPFADQLTMNINQSVFFSLSIPIFNGFTTRAGVKQAEVGVLQSKYAQESTENVLTQAIESAWADAIAAQKIFLAQKIALSSAELAFANTELKFESGAISAIDYADSRTRLDNARVNMIRNRYDLLFKTKILDFYQGKAITLR
jgi:outer membrane protein